MNLAQICNPDNSPTSRPSTDRLEWRRKNIPTDPSLKKISHLRYRSTAQEPGKAYEPVSFPRKQGCENGIWSSTFLLSCPTFIIPSNNMPARVTQLPAHPLEPYIKPTYANTHGGKTYKPSHAELFRVEFGALELPAGNGNKGGQAEESYSSRLLAVRVRDLVS